MTRKQQGLLAATFVIVFSAVSRQLGKLEDAQFLFGLSSDFFAGVLIGFTIILGIVTIVKLLPKAISGQPSR